MHEDTAEKAIYRTGVDKDADGNNYGPVKTNTFSSFQDIAAQQEQWQGFYDNQTAMEARRVDVNATVSVTKAAPTRATTLPTDAKGRKNYPVATGVLDYFPDALVAIAEVSKKGNDQHNPGQKLHWAREKSTDQDDTIIRHFLQRGSWDSDGIRHTAKMVWRALAMLQLEIEREPKESEPAYRERMGMDKA